MGGQGKKKAVSNLSRSSQRSAGRPRAIIDWQRVGDLLKAHCSAVGIAGNIGISVDTLYLRCKQDNNIDFTVFSEQKKAEGVSLVEESIYRDVLTKGGIDRIFWLKNKAGWKDQQNIDHTNNGTSFKNLSDDELIAVAARIVERRPAK